MAFSTTDSKSVIVVGGGVAGMSAACALAEAGLHVQLVERRGYLGGRASSYLHPGVREVIDNCQHVLFGCCTNLLGFYRRIHVERQIHWTGSMTMIEPGGRRSYLGPSESGLFRLPAPLHGLASMLRADAFTLGDKIALGRAFSAMMQPAAMRSTETLDVWLKRHKQTEGTMTRFWRLVIASALNAEIEAIAVPYAAKVIRELFLNSAEAGKMGMSRVPLSSLYAGVTPFLEGRGGRVDLNKTVQSAEWDESTGRWNVETDAGPLAARFVVFALPFDAMGKLLSTLPKTICDAETRSETVDRAHEQAGERQADQRARLAEQIAQHVHWPICSVHLWFDREITDLEHAILLDREIHWMYNQSRLQTGRGGHYLELVVSASRSFAALPREAAIGVALKELGEFFPQVQQAHLEKVALVKEVRATFGVPPGIDAARPNAIAPWKNLFLGGDWTATGWPSTMESAARSGHLAAEALLAKMGTPRTVLEPDLKPQGWMRWFS